MYLDKNTAKLVCQLEHIIGSECHNQYTYDGGIDKYGKSFRYPVKVGWEELDEDEILDYHFEGSIQESKKIKGLAFVSSPELISTMHYQFGSNRLFIGDGILRVLNYLEEYYKINFNELEEIRLKKSK